MMRQTDGREEGVVIIYTDGACLGNPGPGGWAALLRYGDAEREIVGSETATTNQRMELTAAVEALKALKRPCHVRVYSDSAYLVNAFRLGWLARWSRNGWKTSGGHGVENQDLWKELLELVGIHRQVSFHKVKGHSGDKFNDRVDALAHGEAQKAKARLKESSH